MGLDEDAVAQPTAASIRRRGAIRIPPLTAETAVSCMWLGEVLSASGERGDGGGCGCWAAGGEEENAENRLSVDLLLPFSDLDVGLEARRNVHELGGGASVETELVLD